LTPPKFLIKIRR